MPSQTTKKGFGLGVGGNVLGNSSSFKASQVTRWPKLRTSHRLLTLRWEEPQPCKVDEEIQNVIMSVEILCKRGSSMRTKASCRLWLLDAELGVGVQMRCCRWAVSTLSPRSANPPPHSHAFTLFSPALPRRLVWTCTYLGVSPQFAWLQRWLRATAPRGGTEPADLCHL